MSFPKGHPAYYKKQVGNTSKKTQEFRAAIEHHDFKIAEEMIFIYREAKEQYETYKGMLEDNRLSPMEDRGAEYLKVGSNQLRDIASYYLPKLKSVEHSITTPTETMELPTKIEALEQYLTKLKGELKLQKLEIEVKSEDGK